MSQAVATVTAPAGLIQGLEMQGTNQFLGIRYAQAPVGAARFQAPVSLGPASGPVDATRYGDRNFQVSRLEMLYENFVVPGEESEDCLFLNVFTPADQAGPMPVMVWLHGGAYQSGSGNEYDPSRIVRDNGVIVVTVNYRLGIFGFLNLAKLGSTYAESANLGIQDQIAALRWVQDNIAAFGGDAGNVTIFGESAGAGSVLALLGAPAAEGLFHKGIVCSGGETLTPPLDQLEGIKAALGCSSDEACLERLLAMPARELSALQQQVLFYAGPSLDGVVITRPACEAIKDGGAAGVAIMAGATRDEGTLLAPLFAVNDQAALGTLFGLSTSVGRDDGAAYREFLASHFEADALVEQLSRAWFDTFRASALRTALTASLHGAGGWVYNFEVETDHPLGVTHYADVPFTFNWIEEGHPRLFTHPASAINQQLAERWSRTVVAFAATGSPNGQGLPEWPRYETDRFACLRLRQQPEIVANPDGDDMLGLYRVV